MRESFDNFDLGEDLRLLGLWHGGCSASSISGAGKSGQRFVSPRIWLIELPSAKSAEAVIACLGFSSHCSAQVQELRAALCPRYGCVKSNMMAAAEITQYREGIRQFWAEPNVSRGNWYKFARQLHPNRTALLHAAEISDCKFGAHEVDLGGALEPIAEGIKSGSLRYTDRQKQEMHELQESIQEARRDPRLSADERIAFEAQQLAAFALIRDNPVEVPFGEQPTVAKQLSVILNPPQITIMPKNGSEIDAISLTADQAACLQYLVEARDWRSSREIGSATEVQRSDRIVKMLREDKLAKYEIIETAKWGSRVKPEWLD